MRHPGSFDRQSFLIISTNEFICAAARSAVGICKPERWSFGFFARLFPDSVFPGERIFCTIEGMLQLARGTYA